jgi:hypothetical protein
LTDSGYLAGGDAGMLQCIAAVWRRWGVDLLAIFGDFEVVDQQDQEDALLLTAHLASLLDGLEAGHIDGFSFDEFKKQLRVIFEASGLIDSTGSPTGTRLRAEVLWGLLRDAMTITADCAHPKGRRISLSDTRASNADFCGRELLTVGAIEYQGEMVRRGAASLGLSKLKKVTRPEIARKAYHRKALAEVVDCCNHALSNGLMSTGTYLKRSASDITWVTPVESRVATLVSRPDPLGLTRDDLTELRNLLGLWAENGRTKRPLAAFFLECFSGLAAPNVFTAQGYARFRHRPSSTLPSAPTSGLTYNLDRKAAKSHPGAQEIVTDAMVLPQVKKIVSGGHPRGLQRGPNANLKSHQAFCADVLQGRVLGEILVKLEAMSP